MSTALKQYVIAQKWVAADASDDEIESAMKENVASGNLSLDKLTELLSKKDVDSKDKMKEFVSAIGETVAEKNREFAKDLVAALNEKNADEDDGDEDDDDDDDIEPKDGNVALIKRLDELESRLKKVGGDGASLRAPNGYDVYKMAAAMGDETDSTNVRVKRSVEAYSHKPTALTYKSGHSKLLGLHDTPMQYNGKDVNRTTDRSKALSATWLKFQLFPDNLTEREKDMIHWAMHHEKFCIPNKDNDTEAKFLTDQQRQAVWDFNMNFYRNGHLKAVIDDSTSGGENAIPEFFDMDMIVTPTLAGENIPSFCNVVPVPRGTAAQNFTMGRPTIAAANTEGSAVGLFSTSSFIAAHDTTFFRAAGYIEIGKNYALDAHPRLVDEIQSEYLNSVRLWFNEQIMTGDGTTEPQGITVAGGTTDVTPATPTTGAWVLNDAFDILFGVGKAHREKGGRGNAIYVMSDTTYQRFRRIATGVTGDTRLVFGDSIESYELFGHPVLIEEAGMTNQDVVFCQMKGYRLYIRQGPRFVREDGGTTLVRSNSFIVGVDVRAGGQLDLGAFAAVVDGGQT